MRVHDPLTTRDRVKIAVVFPFAMLGAAALSIAFHVESLLNRITERFTR